MPKTSVLAILLLSAVFQAASLSNAPAWDGRLVSAVRYDDLELARHLLERRE